MARSKIPDALERRHQIERELPPEKALQMAEAYLEEGRSVEAVEFLRKAGAAERLGELRQEALAAGDVFLLRAAATAAGAPPERHEWAALADEAARAGKDLYAHEARRQAEAVED